MNPSLSIEIELSSYIEGVRNYFPSPATAK